MQFEYPEDRGFFVNLLNNGNDKTFDKKFKDYFDFRSPDLKRKEFGYLRDRMFVDLIKRDGYSCQLKCHLDCSKSGKYVVDHFIPLSSNQLNKQLRDMKAGGGKKAPTQSFGSNYIGNLLIACERCNAYKQNKFYPKGPSFSSKDRQAI